MTDSTSKSLCLVPAYARVDLQHLSTLLEDGVKVVTRIEYARNLEGAWVDARTGVPSEPVEGRILCTLLDAELARNHHDVIVWCPDSRTLEFAKERGFETLAPDSTGKATWTDTSDAYFCSARTPEKVVSPALRRFVQTRSDTASSDQTNEIPMNSTPSSSIVDADHTIAIVGIGAIMPGASTAPDFWRSICAGYSAITDVPHDRWDPSLYWSADRDADDKTYSKIGGWIRDFEFDRKAFRLPPTVVQKTDPTQLVCLQAVKEALADSGYDSKDFDRERCAVVLGNALGGDLRDQTNLRIQYPQVAQELRGKLVEIALGRLSEDEIERILEETGDALKDTIVGISEDSMPGELANVIAGRVAQAFNLRGPNYVIDAACASSLAAIEAAVRGLRSHQYDMAISGGVDRTMGATSFVKFSKIGALSPDGSRPFDANANGFVMGEGAGILVLKRLSDAIRDDDSIYALIRGVGGSSDGRGKGITAPNPRGQKLAVKRAYEDAGYGPATVSLVEAHGTSTPVGDPTEFASLRSVFEDDDGPVASDTIALGSVKSMIGHLKSAAAAASTIKVAYALKHGTLPPTINVQTPNPAMEIEKTRFRLQTSTEEWTTLNDAPRRAAVSAFGFGGTNFHLTLEEYLPASGAWRGLGMPEAADNSSTAGRETLMNRPKLTGGILAFSSDSYDGLRAEFESFQQDFATAPQSAVARRTLDLKEAPRTGEHRLALAFDAPGDLPDMVARAARGLERNKGWRVLSNQGVFYGSGNSPGQVAMLFPGQGSQYVGMLQDLRAHFDVVQETFDEADQIMAPILGKPLSGFIFPNDDDQEDAFLRLSQTEITQPAVLTVDVALFRLLGVLGITPHMVGGHSLGEYAACVAAGVMPFEDALKTVAARGTEMANATPMHGDPGLMAGVSASADVVSKTLDEIDGYVVCANKNCTTQTIIAGLTESVQEAIERFGEQGLECVLLPVSHAFHSKVVAAASKPLRSHLEGVGIAQPKLPILTNVTGGPYPNYEGCEDAIRDLLAEQVAAPVEFIEMIERMHDMGARVFIEVGPKRAQSAFVSDILSSDSDVVSLYTNHPKKGDVGSLLDALATLWALGTWSTTMTQDTSADSEKSSEQAFSRAEVLDHMLSVLCEKTGYDPDEIETDFELEADLGIDTVKQAEIMASVRETYGFERDDEFRLAEYPSLDRLADYVMEKLGDSVVASTTPSLEKPAVSAAPHVTPSRPVPETTHDRKAVLEHMLGVLCEKTGYDPDEIETDFELEADLGIDTVKQAEIMASVRETYGFERDDEFRLAEYPSLDRLADYVMEKLGDSPAPVASTPEVKEQPSAPTAQAAPAPSEPRQPSHTRVEVLDHMLGVLCEKTGYDPDEIETDFELEADLGIDTVKQAEIMASVRETYGFERDDEFRLAEYPSLDRLADYVMEKLDVEQPTTEPVTVVEHAPVAAKETRAPVEEEKPAPEPRMHRQESRTKPEQTGELGDGRPVSDMPRSRGGSRTFDLDLTSEERNYVRHDTPSHVSITGAALGLPEQEDPFDPEALDRLIEGSNMIGDIPENVRQHMVDKRIVRLVKHKGGGGEMVEVQGTDEAVKLAGRMGDFDLADYGIPERLQKALDQTSQLAMAAGLLALRDAGLPLIPRYRETSSGKKVTIGWTLPESVGRETGVIFASAFAGQDALIEELEASHREDYKFNHRYLLRVLGIANSRFAEFVGARGPNTKINNACASTTTAIAMAEDWIRLGRCKRVVIVGADNASGDTLVEWIGSGFLATGAASTEARVEDAALPFDRRRDGIIIGMGAVSLVVEADGLAEERGIEPLADVLATRFVNSALHPTRLDVDHIADEVGGLLDDVEEGFDLDRHTIASKTVFVSHETYSPARGGSAAAEIWSLRKAFGDQANQVVIANTKGFTGHAMGAGIEDALAVRALQFRELPPIANFKEPDPDLGDLRLSDGGEHELDYALRLAAGFGSQLALAMLRFRSRRANRLFSARRYRAWMKSVSGFESPEISVEDRVLRLREGAPDDGRPTPPEPGPKTRVKEPADSTFHRDAVVVEAHTAASFELSAIRERFSDANVLVAAGPMLVTDLVNRALERCGANVTVICSKRSVLDGGQVCDFENLETLTKDIEARGPFDGVINLIGFGRDDANAESVSQAARHTFLLAKAWVASGSGKPPAGDHFWISVTGMGGRLGFDCVTGPLPTCGAVCGMTKSLSREWPDATVRIVDVPREGFYPDLGLQILAQATDPSGPVEVGIIGGVRWVPTRIDVRDAQATERDRPALDDAAWLVTGGAKGITAEITVDLASRFGGKYILVGRTELNFQNASAIDLDAHEKRIRDELKAEGTRVTPMAVKRRLKSFESQKEILENMERISEAGAGAVHYVSGDLGVPEDVKSIVEEARSLESRIDAVIHGAGIEISRPLRDKSLEEFKLVFNAKALGAMHLWEALGPDLPDLFVAFSSVAARFGNVAQADYSAANEVLNKLVAKINAADNRTRALSIDWTAWDDVGMAVEGSMKTILEARGVELLPVEAGAPILGDLLEAGFFGEALVAGNLGELGLPVLAETSTDTPRGPLGGRIVEHTNDRVQIRREFNLATDQFLSDHVYEGVALVPGVMGYELMTAAATALLGRAPETLSNVEFSRALKLHHDQPVTVHATAERQSNGDVALRVESSRTSKTGRSIESCHYTARVPAESAERPYETFEIPTDDLLEGPAQQEIYRRYFHTGSFRVLDSVPFVAQRNVVAYGRVPSGPLSGSSDHRTFLTAPMVREMAFQAAGLWGMYFNGRSYLPAGIGTSTTLATELEPGASICVRVSQRDDAPEMHIAFDVDVLDSTGNRIMTLENLTLVGHRALQDSERFEPFQAHRMSWLRLNGPEAQALLADRGVQLESLLSAEEHAALTRLISERRRTEWMAARVAARELVGRWVRDFTGTPFTLGDICVHKDENGAPTPRWCADATAPIAMPSLTLTHSGGVSIAAIAPDSHRIGVDLETIEKREDAFIRQYFDESELSLAPKWPRETRLAALWCAKEAVSKALGLGLNLQTQEIPVVDLVERGDGWDAVVELTGKAREALVELHGKEPVDVRLHVDTRFAFASAHFSVDTNRATVRLTTPGHTELEGNATSAQQMTGSKLPILDDHQYAAAVALLKHKGLLHPEHLNGARSAQSSDN